MARPSIKKQRTEEILIAFSRCLAKFGLAGSTLERLAEESGLQRSLVRHYVGNRENLIRLLADKTLHDYQVMTDQLFLAVQGMEGRARLNALLDLLFDPQYRSSAESTLVLEALMNASANDFPELKQPIADWMNGFSQRLSQTLHEVHPLVKVDQCDAVSFGILSIYFNLDALSPIGLSTAYQQTARQAAQLLLDSLHR